MTAKRYMRKIKNARCITCGKSFDNGGYKYVKSCPTCYETRATTVEQANEWGCCYRCLTQPLGFTCTNRKCECPQHATYEQIVGLNQ